MADRQVERDEEEETEGRKVIGSDSEKKTLTRIEWKERKADKEERSEKKK